MPRAAPARSSITEDELERIATRDARRAARPRSATKLERVPILIDDVPSDDLVADGLDPRAARRVLRAARCRRDPRPTSRTSCLFKRNLERSATDLDHLAEEVRITVLHETAHYFGLDEDDLDETRLGLRS